MLLPTIGSAGDVHPFIALGLALRARGHRATILTNPYFQPLIEQQGLGFLPVGAIQDAEEAMVALLALVADGFHEMHLTDELRQAERRDAEEEDEERA